MEATSRSRLKNATANCRALNQFSRIRISSIRSVAISLIITSLCCRVISLSRVVTIWGVIISSSCGVVSSCTGGVVIFQFVIKTKYKCDKRWNLFGGSYPYLCFAAKRVVTRLLQPCLFHLPCGSDPASGSWLHFPTVRWRVKESEIFVWKFVRMCVS